MTKWNNETIEQEIFIFIKNMNMNRMPTSQELRTHKASGLGAAIIKNGGFQVWAERLNLPMKEVKIKWTEEVICSELLKCMNILNLKRMPTASELQSIGRNDLHCKISKITRGYSSLASKLELEIKNSETTLGCNYEEKSVEILEEMGFNVDRMTTKHPYDLLIDNSVK